MVFRSEKQLYCPIVVRYTIFWKFEPSIPLSHQYRATTLSHIRDVRETKKKKEREL